MPTVPLVLAAIAVVAVIVVRRYGFWGVTKSFLDKASGEFLLKRKPNGGDVIFVRTMITSAVIYVIAIGLKERLAPGATWEPSLASVRAAVADSLPWLGAIFTGVYAAFYTRFSSQWIYLAGVYNQLMGMQVRDPDDGSSPERSRSYAAWRAGFIEDAEAVHLALKPMYASVIAGLLGDPAVRRTYEVATVNGSARLIELEKRLRKLLGAETYDNLHAIGGQRASERDRVSGTPTPAGLPPN